MTPNSTLQLKTLQEAFEFFSAPQNCVDYVIAMRWPDGKVSCPTCGSEAVTWLPTRFLYQCKGKHTKRQFSVKVGTVLEDSPITLGKWLLVMWMIGSCRNGISSYEVARTIGITQKSAWFMLHRLREAMGDDTWALSGEVEVDETYVGGKPVNKHARKRSIKADSKAVVFGMVERGGRVIAAVTPNAKEKTIIPIIKQNVSPEATVYTDSYGCYDHLHREFTHFRINHQQDAYVVGPVHTNTIENFWSCLKRMLKGTYVAVSPRHLNAYVTEQAFRFNVRKGFTEQQRGIVLLNGIQGKRLTYKELTARSA